MYQPLLTQLTSVSRQLLIISVSGQHGLSTPTQYKSCGRDITRVLAISIINIYENNMKTHENNMKTYICRRGERGWEGALIICADSTYEATKLFKDYEESDYAPYTVNELTLKCGVIYDDYTR